MRIQSKRGLRHILGDGLIFYSDVGDGVCLRPNFMCGGRSPRAHDRNRSAQGKFAASANCIIRLMVVLNCRPSYNRNFSECYSLQKHNKHFDVEVEADLELEPSSEHDTHSPYRKKQSFVHHSNKSKASTDSASASSMDKHQAAPSSKNGHYELVDSTRMVSQKRVTVNKTKNSCGTSGASEQWPSKCVHHQSYTGKQSAQQQQHNQNTYEHCIVKQNTRTHHKSLSNRILSLKRENKTTQTLSIVVGGFIVCWLPFFICYLIKPFLPSKSINETLSTMLTWLGWLNSAMNPFIYAFYSVDFRAAFWRLTFRRFFKNANKAPYSSNMMSIKR